MAIQGDKMRSIVYYGSAKQAQVDAKETLPAKLNLIMNKLNLRERVKDELVVIKIHSGNNIGYSTIHPVFIRQVVQAIKEGGGKPFVADVNWDVDGAEARGYTQETLGCPIQPAAGPSDKYYYTHAQTFRGMKEWRVAGAIQDASFLVNFAHFKGHPCTGYGGTVKNLALGCVTGHTRGQMHDVVHYEPYFFPEKCPNKADIEKISAACPWGAIVEDREHPGNMHLHFDACNQCLRCMKVAPAGSLNINASIFDSFVEAMIISTGITLSTFAPGKAVHLSLATFITPMCDCFGFSTMPILPDAGVFGSDDIVAVDQATLDITGQTPLIEEAIPTSMEVHTRKGHPLQWLHGPFKDPYKTVEYAEKYKLGSRQYDLVDVFPVEKGKYTSPAYIPASK
jgi:uncharacterized protein